MHSTAEVSRILGMSEARVRELVRSGLCRPARRGRGYAFSFQDLVVLCAANGLMQQDIPPARVRRSLAALVQQLPSDRPLSGLRIYADGGQVAVRDGATAWHPETGQTVLDFGVGEIVERAEKLRAPESRPPRPDPRDPYPDRRGVARRCPCAVESTRRWYP